MNEVPVMVGNIQNSLIAFYYRNLFCHDQVAECFSTRRLKSSKGIHKQAIYCK